MKLASLSPMFLNAGGDDVFRSDGTPAPRRTGVGIIMDCPCGNKDENHQLYVPFRNPTDGGPPVDEKGWERTGSTIDDLTLSPSILRPDGCKWHGWIRAGEVISC